MKPILPYMLYRIDHPRTHSLLKKPKGNEDEDDQNSYLSEDEKAMLPEDEDDPSKEYVSEIEQLRSECLLQLLDLPSSEEKAKRNWVVNELEKIVRRWVRNHTKAKHPHTVATVLPFGSHGLDVHTSDSDINVLCVGSSIFTGHKFRVDLRNMISSHTKVSEMKCDKEVPSMCFKFDGISVDFPYAQLAGFATPEIFQELLRCVKLWANRRGVYGLSFGYLGGVHLAVLVAYICRKHPNVQHLSVAMVAFFNTFSTWDWRKPVSISAGDVPSNVPVPPYIPIQLPHSADKFCHSHITSTTSQKIKDEFRRGQTLTMSCVKDSNWENLFEPFSYTSRYDRFIKLHIYAKDQSELGIWLSWVKWSFKFLIYELEKKHHPCDPCPIQYSDANFDSPNVVFYWGLLSSRDVNTDDVREYFMRMLIDGYKGPLGNLTLAVVYRPDIPKNSEMPTLYQNISVDKIAIRE